MKIGNKTKASKLSVKKDFSMKTQRAVMPDIPETAGSALGNSEATTAAAVSAMSQVTNEERFQLIAEAAYYRAERRSFAPGYEMEDWLNAEAEIEYMISKNT
jgi:hypothetical protein